MKKPLICRRQQTSRERGMTIALVAVMMLALIGMAALSIDLVALYLAREEAQRTADTAALAAARVLSITGVTGDPDNIQGSLPSSPWPAACTLASQVAQAVVNQNSVGSAVPTTTTVTFSYNGTSFGDCSAPSGTGFALNPQVQVQVVRQSLPAFFARIWGQTTNQVSASSIAEAYNSSNSQSFSATGNIIPVNPRCVKPWMVANEDPKNGSNAFVDRFSGALNNEGERFNFAIPGIVGERYTYTNGCGPGTTCSVPIGAAAGIYVPALVTATPVGYPSCANGDTFQQAIGGCDQSTTYACGTQNGVQADLSQSYDADTNAAAQCLIRQPAQDTLNTAAFPYQIQPGASNPVITSGTVSSSSSIVSLPIYDSSQAPGSLGTSGLQPSVTIVGFLQVFINQAYPNGNLDLTVLNVAGCGNGTNGTGTPVGGTSPVPVRLITPP
jgi:Flp pilus assembly protein TadG